MNRLQLGTGLLACALMGLAGCAGDDGDTDASTTLTNPTTTNPTTTNPTTTGMPTTEGPTGTDSDSDVTTEPGTDGDPVCGDGVVSPGEECDNGADNADDAACTSDCQNASCGDGLIGPGEVCDDGDENGDNGACTGACVFNVCGDGLNGPDEECDEGAANDDDAACTPECKLAVCGDGLVGPGEACDDGNDVNDDDCSNECAGPNCGDGILQLQENEECDDGNDIDTDACLSNCVNATCGDNVVYADGGEECDGGGVDTADCDNDCTLPLCGDGYINTLAAEECDDQNDVDDDACSNACISATCDDGIKNDLETDIDCGGGACDPCITGDACTVNEDCLSQLCQGDLCAFGEIVIAALPGAYRGGDIGGIESADLACQNAANANNEPGTWIALLATQNQGDKNRDFTTIFMGAQATMFPVNNILGTQLLPNWNQMFINPSGSIANDVYTFTGLEVEEGNGNPDWNDADGWTGALTNGLVAPGLTCQDWTVSNGSGRNTELDARQLLRQETKSCNTLHAVMCVRVFQ